MKLYSFLAQDNLALSVSANDACTKIAASPALFAISSTNATSVAAKATDFATKVDNVLQAKLALEAAIIARNASRALFVAQFQSLLTQSYANPAVSDESLGSIGLDPREPRQNRPLRQPLDLKVVPDENGYITATWKRNQNTAITVFTLQAFADGEWEDVWTGTRVRVVLSGWTPGEERTFRVVASKSGEVSAPSNNWTIYGDGSTLAGRLAA